MQTMNTKSLTGRTPSLPPMQELPRRPSPFMAIDPVDPPVVRMLPFDYSALEHRVLNKHYMPSLSLGGDQMDCKGPNCPACKVNVPVQSAGGPGYMNISVAKHRSLAKQIRFGDTYGFSGTDLRNRLFPHAPRADNRKRSTRIANKIKKRKGWLKYRGPAEMVANGMFDAMFGFGMDPATTVRQTLTRLEQETFQKRHDVVEMREAMLAAGVPRPERQKAYRALRRITTKDLLDPENVSIADIRESMRKVRFQPDAHFSQAAPVIDYMDRFTMLSTTVGSAPDYQSTWASLRKLSGDRKPTP